MKHFPKLSVLILLFASFPLLHAQVPQGIQYQAVARDAGGNLLANQSLDVRFSIKTGSAAGSDVFVETHSTPTNDYGLFTLTIGSGTASVGTFTGIDWPGNDHFLQVEIDPGAGFVNMGAFQLLSVPYSLYSDKSGTAINMTLDELMDVNAPAPANGDVLKWDGSSWKPASDAVNDADSDPSNEIQTLTLSGQTLSISGGNSINLPAGSAYTGGTGINVAGNIISNTAPDQTVSLTGSGATSISGTYPNFTVTSTDNVNDADSNPTNEIQSLTLSGSTLSLSGSNAVNLPAGTAYTGGTGINVTGNTISNTAPDQTVSLIGVGATSVSGTYPNFAITSTDNVNDADSDPSNELQTLTLSGNSLGLTGGNNVTLPTGTTYSAGTGIGISGNTINNTAPDQTVTLTGSGATNISGTYPNFTITSTDNVNDADSDPSNELQTLTLSGNTLGLTGGNSISLPSSSTYWNASGTDIYKSNSGNVGIGTTSPGANLEIRANSSLSAPHLLLSENGNDYARLNFDNNNGSNYWTIAAYIASNNRNDRLNFWNGTGGDLLTLTGDGELGLNVGISPKTTFHVGDGGRVLFGIDTLGNGDKLMFLPDLHAFRVGTVATGAASTYWNRDSIGLYSFASGLNTRAQGYGATAMGRDTEATNSYAFATGYFSNADGQYSTAMGFNTDALALGSTALGYSTDAEENYTTAMGYFAEAQAIYSVAIGNAVQAQSYSSMAVGRYNVGGGNATSWVSSDPIFEVGIGSGPSSTANAMTILKNGNVGIGTTTPQDALQVNGRVRFQTVEYFEDGGTNEIAGSGDIRPTSDNVYDLGTASFRWDDVYATNGTIQTSDRRDKENITDLNYGLSEVMQLRPVRFTWKGRPDQGEKLGLIAQELLPVIHEVVKTHNLEPTEEDHSVMLNVEQERMGVYYSDLIPVLIKGMQEQQAQIEEQRAENAELRKELDDLRKMVEAIRK